MSLTASKVQSDLFTNGFVPNGSSVTSPTDQGSLDEEILSDLDALSQINLHEELEDLDPDEFELPPIEHQPTLDEILADSGSTIDTLSEIGFTATGNKQAPFRLSRSHSLASTSLGSSDVGSTGDPSSDDNVPHVLKCTRMRSISAQLSSLKEKIDAGSPSAIAMSSHGWTAVGTSHSLILVFDEKEILKMSLGKITDTVELGQVSCLAWSPSGHKLLVGFARGQLALYDITQSRLVVRMNKDVHALGHAVLHACFMHESTMALCVDSGGSIFLLKFRRGIGKFLYKSHCVFSGCKGEACVVRPLLLPPRVYGHVVMNASLFAMATLTKVIVLRLRPSVKVVFACALSGRPQFLPMLDWQFVPMQLDHRRKVLDPVLMFGRDTSLYFYQVNTDDSVKFKVTCIQKIELPYSCVSFHWLSSQSFALVDHSETLHLWDMTTMDQLESTDVSHCQLVYSVADWKGLAGGGNVSPALAFAGERACYYSFAVYKNELFILGTNNVYHVQIRSWIERVNAFVAREDYQGAIKLGLSFTEGRIRAGTGLGRSGRWKNVIADRVADLILQYAEAATTSLCPEQGRIERLIVHYKSVLPLLFDACVRLSRYDLLLDNVWEIVQHDLIAKAAYLDCFYEEVLNDNQFGNIPVSPVIIQELWNHLEQEGLLTQLEQCILRMDITRLDLHQVMTICRKHRLYDGIIFVHNRALNDYVTPLKAMISELRSVIDCPDAVLSDEDIKIGNKALLYLSSCLCGRVYPVGDLDPETAGKVSFRMYQFINAVHTEDPPKDEPTYPNMRTFLRFDTPEFLNVMTITFETKEFSGERGLSKCQKLLDSLLNVVLNDSSFSMLEVGALFTFCARMLVRKPELSVSTSMMQQLLESLACNEASVYSSGFLSRQQAFLDLLQSERGRDLMAEDELIQLASKTQFWQVCEYLYLRRGELSKIIDCYLNDILRKEQVFRYIHKTLSSDQITKTELKKCKSKAVESVKELCLIDVVECSTLIDESLSDYLSKICDILGEDGSLLLELLGNIWEVRNSKGHTNFSKDDEVSREQQNLYIKLLCQLKGDAVVPTLQENQCLKSPKTLLYCREFNVRSGVVYLLEEDGKFEEAFEYLLEELKSLPTKVEGENNVLCHQLAQTIQFCNRNSERVDRHVREKLWFPLLDFILQARVEKADLSQSLLHDVISSMLTYVDAAQLMERLFQSSVLENGQWNELKPLMDTIFSNYQYQQTLLERTHHLLEVELCQQLTVLQRTRASRLYSEDNVCRICGQLMDSSATSPGNRAIVFGCKHVYHSSCLDAAGAHKRGASAEKEWVCPGCSTSARRRRSQMNGVEGNVVTARSPNLFNSKMKNSGPRISVPAGCLFKSKARGDSLSIGLLDELAGRNRSDSQNPFSVSVIADMLGATELVLSPPVVKPRLA